MRFRVIKHFDQCDKKNYLLAMPCGIFDVYKNNGLQLTLNAQCIMQFISDLHMERVLYILLS